MQHRTSVVWSIFLLALLGGMLAGCGPQFLTYNSISFLQKGMDQATVHERMDVSATSTITMFEQGQTYVFEYYPLQTAQSKSTNTTNNYGAYGQVTSKVTTTTITDYTHTLIVLYKERRLRYWGMMGDLSKSEDPEILAIAPAIYQKFIFN